MPLAAIDLIHAVVVIDTNILAYLLIEGDHTREAQALLAQEPQWHSEASVLIEFSNILATYQRIGDPSRKQAERLLKKPKHGCKD